MNKELWKTIKNYPDYEISNLGNVRSWKYTNSPRLLSPVNVNGYQRVRLCNNSRSIQMSIHRLVCEQFKNKPKTKKIIDHLDGNKANNNIDNLEWCTQKKNIQKHFSRNHDKNCKTCKAYFRHIHRINKYK